MEKRYTKSITPVDDYVCTLSEKLKKKAEEECRETEESRKHAIESLREWAEKNPRINKLRLDSVFLLKFLRARKYSLPMAKEQIERYLVLRSYEQEGYKLFEDLDVRMPMVQELLNMGYLFALPERDAEGRRIVFCRARVFNPSKHFNYQVMKVHSVVYESIMEDEENQINGYVHVVDGTGIGFNYLTVFTPQEAYRIGKNMEKLLPMRHKEVHGLKVHPSVKFAVDFALAHMSTKMKNRVFLHKNVSDVVNVVDKKLLPAEYGGTMPIAEMVELFKKELESKRDLLLKYDQMSVNLEYYPASVRSGSVRSLNKTIESFAESLEKNKKKTYEGVQGSFRKLEID